MTLPVDVAREKLHAESKIRMPYVPLPFLQICQPILYGQFFPDIRRVTLKKIANGAYLVYLGD